MHVNVIVDGLTLGSIYALVAISFNILYRPSNVFNFAQGQAVMLGAMLGALGLSSWGLPWIVNAVGVMAAIGALCLAIERVAVRPVLSRSAKSETWIITTLAVSLILSDVAGKIWSDEPRQVPAPPGLSLRERTLGSLSFSSYDIFLVIFTIVLVAIIERLYRTRTGRAVMAVAEDRDAARLRGIDPNRLTRVSFFVGGGLAGLAGLMAAPMILASTALGPLLLIKGFAAAALGGIGSNKGALVAGYLVGLVESVAASLLEPGYQSTMIFAVMLAVLMVRPTGLFGVGVGRTV